MKKVINFLDNHRVILVLLIIIIVVILFITIKSIMFLNHDFKSFKCSEEVEDVCYFNGLEILKNPEEEKDSFFMEHENEINKLKEKYSLPTFNHYTAYYYYETSSLDYILNSESEVLLQFFRKYCNTYNIEKYYQENVLFYNLYYHYKIK